MFETLKDTLEAKLKAAGKAHTEVQTEILKFSYRWYEANPPFPSFGHLQVKYLALPRSYSQAQLEVVKEFDLLKEHPRPPL